MGAWGNALGGFRDQKRTKGRFGFKPGGRKIKGALKKHNPGGVKFGNGKKSKNISIVPYARQSLSSTTGGVNAGANISKKYRISTGAYFRVERRAPTELEKKIKAADRKFFGAVASKIAPAAYQDSVAQALQAGRARIVNKKLGHQVKVLPVGEAGGYARLTTSRKGIPTVTIRAGKSKVSDKDRRKGINDYNKAMSNLKQNRQKQSRAQRRGKNPIAGTRIA